MSSIIAKTSSRLTPDNFRHPILTENEHNNGCRLGLDTWADTSCAGKHAYVEEFIEGRSVTATGFLPSLGSVSNLPIANVLYAYDTVDGQVFILESNNAIYLGADMDDSLQNPIQCEEAGVRIDLRARKYYPSCHDSQRILFPDGTVIPIKYDGPLPFISVRRPTKWEIHNCTRLQLSDRVPWAPFTLSNSFSATSSTIDSLEATVDSINDFDPIASELMSTQLYKVLSLSSQVELNNGDSISLISAVKSKQSSTLSPSDLSKHLHIGLKTASKTLKATTHQCIRSTGLLSRRFRTDKAQLRYKQLSRRYGSFYCDYLKVSVKSIWGYIGGVMYTNRIGFKKFYPCQTEGGNETGHSLRSFVDIIGLPYAMHSDNHTNFKEGLFKRLLTKFGIYQSFTEPHSPWQNRAEPAIGEVKRYARLLMQRTCTPIRLWCFCYEYSADVLTLLATDRYDLQGRTAYEAVMHYTPDISEYLSYRWFQWCYYFDESTKSKRLCRWLGPAHKVGQSFCSYVILDNAEFIARSSVLPIPDDELLSADMVSQTSRFMQTLEDKIGNHLVPQFNISSPSSIYYEAFNDPLDSDDNVLPYGDELIDVKTESVDEAYLDSLDTYIGTNVVVPGKDGVPVLAKVRSRKRDAAGNPVGEANSNPILDTRVYELLFPDGRVDEYSANVLAENLISSTDSEGWDTGLFDEIIDMQCDKSIAIPKDKGTFITETGNERPVITTKGWDVLIKWQDGSTNWLPLHEVKEALPLQCAQFAKAHAYGEEPAFKWWIHKVLRRSKAMIAKLKTLPIRKGRMKFGILVPGTVEEALRLDAANNNTFWSDAIKKEMVNSRVAFELLEKGEPPPPGYKEIPCHLIFDIKLDLTRKARYVAGGHMTEVPSHMTYSSVVSRDTVRIGLLIAALNDLELLAGDIQNAFLSAPTKERIYFRAGEEWKADAGKVVKVVRALYGLRSSALQFRNHLADTLGNSLGYKSSLANPDLWFKPMTSSSGFKYYAYILVYVDDILIINKDPSLDMAMIRKSFKIKPESIKVPDMYLGADIKKVFYPDGSHAWTMGSDTYTKRAVKNLKERLKQDGLEFNRKLSDPKISAPQPFSNVNYRAELDTSDECNKQQISFYQNLIGILRWLVELGRIDIGYEVSVLSRYLVQPRTGHLLQALHVFKYLEIHCDNELAMDPAYQDVEHPDITNQRIANMKAMYPDAVEDLPTNAPEPRGNPIQINCFVDSDHAGDKVTRQSQTGIILYCNTSPVLWYSKRQNTVESSTFGAEFVALRIASELIISLRYKLRMFGVPISGPSNVFCDNEAVYKNAAFSETTLKKKHNSVCFHRVRECVASGVMVVHKVGTHFNLSDILTKSLPAVQKLDLRKKIMLNI